MPIKARVYIQIPKQWSFPTTLYPSFPFFFSHFLDYQTEPIKPNPTLLNVGNQLSFSKPHHTN